MRLNEWLIASAAARMISTVLILFVELSAVGLVAVDVLFAGQSDPRFMLYGFIVILLCVGLQMFLIIRMKGAQPGKNMNLNLPIVRRWYSVWAIAGGLAPMIGLAAMMAFTGTAKSVVEPVLAIVVLLGIVMGVVAWHLMLTAAARGAQAYEAKHTKKRKK